MDGLFKLNIMICPVCKEQGMKSKLYIGGSSATMIQAERFYDEEGNYHHHDPSSNTKNYECNNGHKFAIITTTGCIQKECDFKGSEQVIITKSTEV